MLNTYQKLSNNTCSVLQGLSYATITDSVRQTYLNVAISTIVPLIMYKVTIHIAAMYLAVITCLTQYETSIEIPDKYDAKITIQQEVRA